MRPGTCSRLGRVRPRTPFRHPVLAMALGLERHPAVVVPSVNGLSRYSRVTRRAQRAGQGIQSVGRVCEPATRAPAQAVRLRDRKGRRRLLVRARLTSRDARRLNNGASHNEKVPLRLNPSRARDASVTESNRRHRDFQDTIVSRLFSK